MARRFHRKERMSALSELNVTPMIDLAFVLLIIFMITAPLLEQTIPLDLPKESQSEQAPRQDTFQAISIDSSGKIAWGEDFVTEEELDFLLESTAANDNPPILHVRADAKIAYQHVVKLLDKIKGHNLQKISLDTQVH